jgi:hypothetical protein
LIEVLVEALSLESNRAALPYFMDFILSTLPHLRIVFHVILPPLIDCVLDQLRLAGTRLHRAITQEATQSTPTSSGETALDTDTTLLLNGLEKIIALVMVELGHDDQDRRTSDYYGLKNLTDLVTGVFGADFSADPPPAQHQIREMIANYLSEIITVTQSIWTAAVVPVGDAIALGVDSRGLATDKSRIHYRVRKLYEAVLKLFPADTFEAIVERWTAMNPEANDLGVRSLIE